MRITLFSIIAFLISSVAWGVSSFDVRRDEILFGTGDPQWNWKSNINNETVGGFCSILSRDSDYACEDNKYSTNAMRRIYCDFIEAYTQSGNISHFQEALHNFFSTFKCNNAISNFYIPKI